MTDQELNRAVQYVTASTSYGRKTVESILKIGFSELTELALQSTRQFEREALLEYVSQWTIKRTGQPEPLVREVLGCAGRWLDDVYEEVAAGASPKRVNRLTMTKVRSRCRVLLMRRRSRNVKGQFEKLLFYVEPLSDARTKLDGRCVPAHRLGRVTTEPFQHLVWHAFGLGQHSG